MSIIPFDFYVRGMLIGWLHLCVGFFLDITFSKDEYNELKKNKKLWIDAWKYIQINLLIITPIVYTFIILYTSITNRVHLNTSREHFLNNFILHFNSLAG